MGNSCSSLNAVSDNTYLKRLCSTEVLSENDPFWNAFLSFSLVDLDLVAMTSSNSKLLDDTVALYCKNFAINNVKSGNFYTLVTYFINRLDSVASYESLDGSTNPFTWQVLNALFIIRIICKYFIQNLSEEVIIQQFLKPSSLSDSEHENIIPDFLASVTRGLTEIPIHETTVLLHLEMVNCLITLLAMVMYDTDTPTHKMFYIEIMEGQASQRALPMTQMLLTSYAYSDKIPSYIYNEEASYSLSSTLWSVMTLGMASGSTAGSKKASLGTQALLLLHILTSHPSTENPYRTALAECSTEEQPLIKPEAVYEMLCKDVGSEQGTLLLYKLLHENQVMKAFILSKTDVEKVTEPLLQVLYEQNEDENSHHIYLTLIVLLMLTEDDSYNKDLFQTKLQTVKWYKDRHLTDLTLGDIFILVIIKTMHYNMAHTKDQYLHTNCLAALANMSSKFVNLHPYVCQRLIAFYSTLVKRHHKTVEKLQLISLKNSSEDDGEVDGHSSHLSLDLAAIEDMLKMVLEIINSCITHTVHMNTHLVHVMLCHREEFDRFRQQESFKHILQNIHLLLAQFHNRLEDRFGEHPRSVDDVLAVISEYMNTFRRGQFLKFPDLKFKYIEESDPSRFFVPYVWQIVCRVSNLHFKQSTYTSS